MAVVGAGPQAPASKKALAAAKKLASLPALPSSRGVDPTLTVVEKKVVAQDESEGRPDKAAYDAEQDKLKAEIDVLQTKANDIKARIGAVSGKGPNNERKVALRAELDGLRGQQATIKGGRTKTLDQVKALQDNIGNKIKDLQAAKAKLPFKSVGEVDAQIKALERQVESGLMALVAEKKALQEMSTLKKTRKVVESFAAQQAAIDADKKKVDAIRDGMNDPEAKAISDKFAAVKGELDLINKAHDEASKGRDGLFEERNAISKELDAAYTKKKESAALYREVNNKFYQKMNDDRTKRLERQRTERQAHEDSKRAETNERLREEAQAPAFEREIEDCATLIDFFQRRIGIASTAVPTAARLGGPAPVGLPKLGEARVIDATAGGGTALVRKGEQVEEFFMGGGGKKGKKGKKPVVEGEAPATQVLNLPFGTLSALLTLGITSPITTGEVPATIEALEIKKKYFVDNQDRVTKDKIAAVEKKMAAADAKSAKAAANGTNGTATPAAIETPVTVEAAAETKVAEAVEVVA